MKADDLFSLKGQLALVTGASRGIGKQIAIGLARYGADIIAVSRSVASLKATCDEVEQQDARCYPMVADVADIATVSTLFEQIDKAGLLPDILINNAGVEQVSASVEVDEALWDQIIDTNLKGAFFVARNFARTLLATGHTGSIVNMGSLTSAIGVPTATPYTCSKSGLLGMTRALSTEWSPQGIRVNAIGPGYFRTDLTEEFYRDEQWQSAMLGKIPMGRFGQLEDLIGIAVFLSGKASAYVSGQIFYVDGGYLASI